MVCKLLEGVPIKAAKSIGTWGLDSRKMFVKIQLFFALANIFTCPFQIRSKVYTNVGLISAGCRLHQIKKFRMLTCVPII